jgi:hypothetical protein
MSGLVEAARRAAARGISRGVRSIGWVRAPRRLRNWLIPPTTRNSVHRSTARYDPRLAILLARVRAARPGQFPYSQGTSRPQAPSIWWAQPAPVTLDSTVFGAPIAPLHVWPRRVFILAVVIAVLTCFSTSGFGQCCGSGCCGGGCCGPSICSPGGCGPGPSCCCPSGGCGFKCPGGCGCQRSLFGFGLFGGGRCCSPCGPCCPPCRGPCGGCGPRCAPYCGYPCGAGFSGGAPCCGSCCGGPAYGLACGPCCPSPCGGASCGSCVPGCAGAPGPCGAGCCPTFETTPAVPPGSVNRPGYPPVVDPGEPIPGVPSTTVPKRPVLPPDDKGTRFERRPVGDSSAAAAFDVTDNRDPWGDEPATPSKRMVRQSASAGFHTRILTAQNSRPKLGSRAANSLALKTRPQDEFASSE